MVHFRVVLDDEVYVLEAYLGLQVVDEFLGEGQPHGVDEHRLFLPDQVGIIAGALVRRIFVPVELLQFPIDFPGADRNRGYGIAIAF
jgi:hypothetical protein